MHFVAGVHGKRLQATLLKQIPFYSDFFHQSTLVALPVSSRVFQARELAKGWVA